MIDINKKYRTRDGREVRIYATDGGDLFEDRTIHGAVKNRDRWVFAVWNATTGRCFASVKGETEMDLIEVRPRHKRTVWVNIYDDSKPALHLSRELADQYCLDRIACIKVELDFEEGEGL
jgi:hypothetical protein